MDLFNPFVNHNLLPKDGEVIYYGPIISIQQANNFLQQLLDNIQWKNDEAVIFGKHIITKRKVAWYADANFSYTYSKTTKQALLWTKSLLELKSLVEEKTKTTYNSCLLNLYHNGDEGMGWHSDDEKELTKNGSIASLSLGAERKFLLKNKTDKQLISVFLENGSLLEMKGTTQTNWLHRLPPTKKVNTPRINLTFRKIGG
ncbi:DNA methylase [Pedobacter psychrophilus]|uniref:DNA methylase n=1 Tax=Pedobacter psychrophilus TaxID=1826909 RepID=A0A179DEB8_9SPHI|nr:alpha-ketoglutarate-dependent dioxygenase AlkB [Pedobacter psychrophilus]OAQ39308.1 DNA methylase [Pedobacter psychrophilus]